MRTTTSGRAVAKVRQTLDNHRRQHTITLSLSLFPFLPSDPSPSSLAIYLSTSRSLFRFFIFFGMAQLRLWVVTLATAFEDAYLARPLIRLSLRVFLSIWFPFFNADRPFFNSA